MRSWQMWFWGILLFLVFVAGLIFMSLWRDLSTYWNTEQSTAQIALNQTPLSHLTQHDVYSGPGGVEDVFLGRNTFKQLGYAFVRLHPTTVEYIPYQDIIPATEALRFAKRYVNHPLEAVPGTLTPALQARLKTTTPVVWEITYQRTKQYGYLYLDASNGQKLWK